MQLRKTFISETLGDATQSGGSDTYGQPPASISYPFMPPGAYGTGQIHAMFAIMIRNDGNVTATLWLSAQGSAPVVPNATQLANPGTGGTVSIPPGKMAVVANAGSYGPFSYVGGPLLVMNGNISYTVDLNPNDPSPVVFS